MTRRRSDVRVSLRYIPNKSRKSGDNRTMCCVVGLASLVGSGVSFFAFLCLLGVPGGSFRSVSRPFSKVGNSELHNTLFDYYSFYCKSGESLIIIRGLKRV